MHTRTFAFRADELLLSGELIAPEEPRATVLLCHGIPGGGPPDPSDTGYAGFASTMAQAGYGAAWFNFRGCRGAPGDFSVQGWSSDLAAAIEAVASAPETRGIPLVVVGSSMGGSTAIAVCARRADVAAVAAFAAPATFASEGGLAEDPASTLARFRNIGIIKDPAFPPDLEAWAAGFAALDPYAAIGLLSPRPVLIVHGDADDVVPYVHAERLFSGAGAPKELVRIPSGTHQLRRDVRAIDALQDWLDRHFARKVGNRPGPDHPR